MAKIIPDDVIYDVLGVPITATNLQAAADRIHAWKGGQSRYVGCRDVASLMVMSETPDLLAIATNAAMNVPDGAPVALLGRIKGHNVSRTCGPDLMGKLLTDPAYHDLKHFFYGGKDGIAEVLSQTFAAKGAQIVGTHCPPFRPLTPTEDARVVAQIHNSGADVVWVGISSPKQDIWMAEHLGHINATMIGVGAAFDFHSGAVERAPKWMQRAGLEWLFRLLQEPRRLWRRYLILAPKFVFRVLTTGTRAA
ncbi:WecB/TagA/CpsF family glycosyltransferase [Marivivens sp.]|jgi:N-acetylglucosaminyldiphosphoundecaprenol N-acetyl-beta-D-mannosaminyltransferase|uniref:WecB/TagA/CpsF family glycosyltransferase n=1 Tax=Marivivens sp. TaxID=1978374 RepID=UPI00201E8483|nr:WecB/TagA/CpsF family glycosyltransferase [Marivivens sp.]MCL7406660.1 WecB/TagA/CpsF family glycosyltransferase [Marivivens geojensis]